MKKIVIFFALSLIIAACTPKVYPPTKLPLRQDIPASTISAIQPIGKTANFSVINPTPSAQYTVFQYGSNNIPSKFIVDVDVTKDIQTDIADYINTKFLSVSGKPDINIIITIKDVRFEYTLETVKNSTALLLLTNTLQFNEQAKTTIIVNATIIKNGQSYSKDFSLYKDINDRISEPETFHPESATVPIKRAQGFPNIFSYQLSAIYNDLIIRLDKFVNSIPQK